MNEHLPALLKLAIEAAQLPAALLMSGFRSDSLAVETKYDSSPVTQFDRNSERMIRAFLAERQPQQWPVLGEEFGGGEDFKGDIDAVEYRWVVDPIDGTLPFTRGMPTFGTMLAFEEVATRRSLVGVIHLPALGETYSAARGLGSWCNGKRMHVAPPRELRDCLISASAEHHFRLAGMAESHEQLRAQAPHVRYYADCWAHAMVARGGIDALVEFRLGRWDIAATEVIVEEAGGVAMTRPASYEKGKYDCVMGSPQAARFVAEILGYQP